MADLVTTRVETLSSDATTGGVTFLLTATLKGDGAPTDDTGIMTVEVTWLDSETVEDLRGTITSAFVTAGSALGHTVKYVEIGDIYTTVASNAAGYSLAFSATFGVFGTGNGQLKSPMGIAVNGSGDVFVVDSGNNRVQKFNSSGTYQSQFGSSGSGNGQFSYPTGIAIDASNNIYVVDGGNHRVQKFNSSGTYQSQFGSNGSGNGQFDVCYGVALDQSGNIYVTDLLNHRVQKFNSSGTYQSQFGSNGFASGQFNYPRGIAIDSNGSIAVADGGNHRIQLFTGNGALLSQIGRFGDEHGEMSLPWHIAYSSVNNRLYVVESGNTRVQSFVISSTDLTQPTIFSFVNATHNHTSAATGGTLTTGTAILKGNGSGGFASAVASTDYAPATTGTSILKASSGGFANAIAGTDYAAASHTHATADITSGTLATARLGSGTASSKNFLRGDQSWQTLGTMVYQNTATSGNIATGARGTQAVSCDAGDTLIAGGCTMSGAAVRVAKSYPTSTSEWTCVMENNTGSNQQVTAYVICLDTA